MYRMTSKRIFFIIILSVWAISFTYGQTSRDKNEMRIAFWNLENYMDPQNDSIANDDDFTISGNRHWGIGKFEKKKQNICKTIIALGEWDAPEIVGLCEVENKNVLNKLVLDTPLRRFTYKFIHYDSPDRRGIDVAMLYRPEKFKPITHFPIPIVYDFDKNSKTRDILYVKGLFANDTLHLFICHFPSKFGGAVETEAKRCFVGNLLHSITDTLFSNHPNANIIIMGDMNDEPFAPSIKQCLNAKTDTINLQNNDLFNLMAKKAGKEGTHKYQAHWSVIDNIIISGSLYYGFNNILLKNSEAVIFKPDFLLMDDEKYLDKKVFRTYNGMHYLGGFSDHLPIYIDIKKQEND